MCVVQRGSVLSFYLLFIFLDTWNRSRDSIDGVHLLDCQTPRQSPYLVILYGRSYIHRSRQIIGTWIQAARSSNRTVLSWPLLLSGYGASLAAVTFKTPELNQHGHLLYGNVFAVPKGCACSSVVSQKDAFSTLISPANHRNQCTVWLVCFVFWAQQSETTTLFPWLFVFRWHGNAWVHYVCVLFANMALCLSPTLCFMFEPNGTVLPNICKCLQAF